MSDYVKLIYTIFMKKVALRRPLIVLLAIITTSCIMYWQHNYRTIPDYVPPLAYLPQAETTEEVSTIVAVGDISCTTKSPNYNNGEGNSEGCHMKQTAALATQLQPEAVLLLGDLQYETGELAQFEQSYAKTWGVEALKRISRPAPGNHEYGTPAASGYYAYFGGLAGDPTKGYYSYDVGGWHVVALNSNCKFVPCDENSEQTRWLRADLEKSQTKCTIAYYHHPLFSSGTHGANENMKPIYDVLDSNEVDLVLAGHDHLYERFAQQNNAGQPSNNSPRSFIVGTGGKSLYPFRAVTPGSEVRISSAYGVLKLDLKKTSYNWQFIDENKQILDTGSSACH